MGWTSTISGTCDYTDTDDQLGVVGMMHRSAECSPPPLWIELPFRRICGMYCDRQYDEETEVWSWSTPALAGDDDPRTVGVRDDRWWRQLYVVDSEYIARAHKCCFRRCRMWLHRIVDWSAVAYAADRLSVAVSHTREPSSADTAVRWAVGAAGIKTVWRPTDVADWIDAIGFYCVAKMTAYLPSYRVGDQGEAMNLDAMNNMNTDTWLPLIQFDETANAAMIVDIDWFDARFSAGVRTYPAPWVGADPAQQGDFYLELDRDVAPAFILGRDEGEDSLANS